MDVKTLQQQTRAICNEEEEERRMDGQTDEQMTVFLPELFGQSCVAWWVPALQWRLGQAILEQAGAKGEKAKGPSTTQTPVPPQWATLGPCGLASEAGRQLAGAFSHPSLVLSISFFDLRLSHSLSLISLHVCRVCLFVSLYPVNLFPLFPSNILAASFAKFHQSSGWQSWGGW